MPVGFCKQGESAVSIVITLTRSTPPIHSVAIQSDTKQTESCVSRGVRSPRLQRGHYGEYVVLLLGAVVPFREAAQSVRQQLSLLWR